MTRLRLIPTFLCSVLILQSAPAAVAESASPVPDGFEAERYRPLWEKSPFTTASAEIIPEANFTDQFAVVSMSRVDDTHYVRIMDKSTQQRFTVTSAEPVNGIEVVEVQSHRNPLEASVRLRRGGEEGTVRYDQTLLSTGAGAAAVNIPVPEGAQMPTAQPQVNPSRPAQPQTGQRPQRRRPIILPRGAN